MDNSTNFTPLPPLKNRKRARTLATISNILLCLMILLAFLVIFGLHWVEKNFSDLALDRMLLQLRMPLKGTGGGYFLSFFLQVFLPSFVLMVIILLIGRSLRQNSKALRLGEFAIFPNRAVSLVLAGIFLASAFGQAYTQLEVPQYLANRKAKSDFIERNYIVPTPENILFPEQKRNLVYIYIESLESSFLTQEQGGLSTQNLMPELYHIAQENVNFSDDDKIGGSVPLSGMAVTSSGMVAQTAGLPLILPNNWDGEKAREIFIPGATTLGDILAENGYKQYLMVGSNATFGARDQYYKAHGNTTIYDLLTARESGFIAPDYDNKFWGMEDKYLYEYAKQELAQIGQGDEPFCFTMLTVDTHFPNGYVCSLCKEEFGDQYSDVIACASRQVSDFVLWLQQQDFYENTTVVITGDHLSMNPDYFTRNDMDQTHRKVFNTFINTADVEPVQTHHRLFSSLDMFPTTLAALGVEITGDRLGLGTDLFSDKPTILEMYDYDMINSELAKTSDYYHESFNS